MHFITCSRIDVWPFTVYETRMPWPCMADSWLSQDMHGDRNGAPHVNRIMYTAHQHTSLLHDIFADICILNYVAS
jgi:hypothetical protein